MAQLAFSIQEQDYYMNDPCKNPNCEFYARCPLRPHVPARGAPLVSRRPPSFKIDGNNVGHLEICGTIGGETTYLVADMLRNLHRLKSVLVIFNSHGGQAGHGDWLFHALLYTSERVPVAGVVKKALSAAFLAMSACTKVFAESDESVFGCFGSAALYCDGHMPQIQCSVMSPNKLPATENLIGPTEFSKYTDSEVAHQQILLDANYRSNLVRISRHRNVPAHVLLEILDGGLFFTRAAKYYDLIDGIATETEVYNILNERKEKNEAIF